MTKCEFDDLNHYPVSEIEVHSLDGGMYVLSAIIDGGSFPVYERGKRMVARDITSLRRRLADCRCQTFFLIQRSAYDEMLGQPVKSEETEMRIAIAPLSDEHLI